MPESAERATARALRSSARIALWASLALTLLAAVVLSRLARPNPFATEMAAIGADQGLWQGVDFETLPEVRTLQEYVRIDTAHPDPDEVAGAEFLAARLAALGVPATIERMGERRANLWAFVEGEERAALVLHSHIDVEPAAAQEGWLYPPFGGVVDGPWIYGRGMYDMKSLAVAQLAAVEAVVRSGRKPRRSLLMLATSSEEAGSDTGTRWILARHPELVERMAVVLTEGGVVESLGPSEIKYWGIEFAQKHFGRVEYCGSDRERLEALRGRDPRRRPLRAAPRDRPGDPDAFSPPTPGRAGSTATNALLARAGSDWSPTRGASRELTPLHALALPRRGGAGPGRRARRTAASGCWSPSTCCPAPRLGPVLDRAAARLAELRRHRHGALGDRGLGRPRRSTIRSSAALEAAVRAAHPGRRWVPTSCPGRRPTRATSAPPGSPATASPRS